MDLGLTDRIVLVVGGTGYIGRAVASRFREEGAIVVAASRFGHGDVTLDAADPASVDAGIREVLDRHGRIDVLVVAAAPAAGTIDPSTTSDPDVVLAGVEGKAMTFLRVASAVLPSMRERGSGRIIAVSGQNAYLTGSILGSVRNAALGITAKNLADEFAGSGITINVVNPGAVVDDPSGAVAAGKPGPSSPEQIAALVAFLASEPAAAISGEAIATGRRVLGVASF